MASSTTAKEERKKSILGPLAPLFTVLNWVAFVGWTYVTCQLLWMQISSDGSDENGLASLHPIVLGLECICLIEVLRIVLGDLPGNVVLGVVLHAIRFSVLTVVLPHSSSDNAVFLGQAIFASWAVTEVSRYPMYMFPGNTTLRNIRMVVPLVTFPWGAAAEGYATFLVWKLQQQSAQQVTRLPNWQHILLLAVLFVNGILGPTVAYPALLKKGLPVLGLTKKKTSVKKKKE
mmetsp:Transcript_23982/g.45608  ORF Transcript_23982/g.45608 Transcript_23982/m.45608 type:complete len:232 (-) Transcript_23982:445-1140(-)|eukprot:scaffold294_cov221-Amphora_coffeaeformis.AAC.46